MPVEEARLLEGKVLAAQIQREIESAVKDFLSRGMPRPTLAVLQAGENPASHWYIGQQEKLAAKLGIAFLKPFSPKDLASQASLVERIRQLNRNQLPDELPEEIHGIFIALPLPDGFDADEVLLNLDPKKDLEGMHPASLGLLVLRKGKLIPPTAYAVLKLIESTGVALRGKVACLIGQSAVVGRPLQLLLGERRVTTLVCNTGTPEAEMKRFVSESDLVIACAGKPGLVKGSWIPAGAIVIDVGTTEVDGKLVGDVEYEEAKKRAAFITPVPGGVGPLTVTMLMQNLVHAYRWQKGE